MAQHYKQPSITESRINVFLGWEAFNPKGNVAPGRMDQNLCGRLWTQNDRSAISLSVASPIDPLECPTKKSLESYKFGPAKIGQKFGPSFTSHLFRLDITVPSSMDGLPVHLLWDSNSEAMVLNQDGLSLQGLVGGDSWCRRADFPLFYDRPNSIARTGDTVRLYIEIACNGLFGAGRGGQIEPPDMNTYYALEECCLAVFDSTAWGLIHDITLLAGLAKQLPECPRRAQALNVANQAINAVDVTDRSTYQAGRDIAAIFLSKKNGESQSIVYSMLHSHIDLAWLWPMAATPAKGARTFSTQLRLMDTYSECIFVQSQAQLYEWVKVKYPSLWKQICARVKEGRFVPVGATWVEMDCNIPSGESLVRQFVLGQQFFMENFGIRCKEFWLPDTFGYSAQLPQIMKNCGVDYFMTQKLSWNLFNKFPHSSFVWEGLDGTRVLAHMPPADTYNAQAFPEEVLRSTNKNKDSGVISDAIMLVGHGDGGGGASPAMVESMRRMSDVDGVPRVKFATPLEFFKQLERKEHDLPRWVGELYFELHRGTYTSQAKTKLENRQSEILLQEAEVLSSHALLLASAAGKTYEYPIEILKACWKLVLKNCFHDTLPGSCIGEVYRETARDYEEVRMKIMNVIEQALKFLISNCSSLSESEERQSKRPRIEAVNGHAQNGSSLGKIDLQGFLVARGTGMQYTDDSTPCVIETSSGSSIDEKQVLSQKCNIERQKSLLMKPGNQEPNILVALTNRPKGLGISSLPQLLTDESSSMLKPVEIIKVKEGNLTTFEMTNGLVRAIICENGVMKSLSLIATNKPNREAISQEAESGSLPPGGGNRLVLYDDVSQFWCGWDTEVYSFEKHVSIGDALSCEIVETGPLRAALHLKYAPTKAGSEIEQFIIIRAGSARIDFRTKVNWKESRKILRVLFNTNIRNDYASYESQFGYVKRPTTFNHSWEIAKFEVVGHRFCDFSEHGFGMALLNDCKYGYSVRDSTMRLSLLRASKSPDDAADLGEHFMTYAVLPHWDSFPNTQVFNEAADLNCPLELIEQGTDKMVEPLKMIFEMNTSVDDDATLNTVLISAVKRSEIDANCIIVRMYEAVGARGKAILKWPSFYNIRKVCTCNMLDEVDDSGRRVEIRAAEGRVEDVVLEFNPFEIRSVALTFL